MDETPTVQELRWIARLIRGKAVDYPASMDGIDSWLVAADWLELAARVEEKKASAPARASEPRTPWISCCCSPSRACELCPTHGTGPMMHDLEKLRQPLPPLHATSMAEGA